jgi:transketolase
MRGASRLAALSGYKSAFVWTHDSVGLGEDGPTHQPIEQLAAFRAMPGMRMIRPADANEVAQAWRIHIDADGGPTALILTRQKIPVLDGTAERAPDGVPRGAYTLADEGGRPELLLVGTGSEVAVCLAARERLVAEGRSVRVVSMPSWDLFEAQPDSYRREVLPAGVPKLAVEAAATFGWGRFVDDAVGIDRFGASAPGAVALDHLGINPDHVVERAHGLLAKTGGSQ